MKTLNTLTYQYHYDRLAKLTVKTACLIDAVKNEVKRHARLIYRQVCSQLTYI